jgi:hypothetical protein
MIRTSSQTASYSQPASIKVQGPKDHGCSALSLSIGGLRRSLSKMFLSPETRFQNLARRG